MAKIGGIEPMKATGSVISPLYGCMYGWMNGTNSDNAVSIQTIASQTWSDDDIRFSHVKYFILFFFSKNLKKYKRGGPL